MNQSDDLALVRLQSTDCGANVGKLVVRRLTSRGHQMLCEPRSQCAPACG